MARPAQDVEEVGRQVERAGSRMAAHSVTQVVARVGILSKSVVYAVAGALGMLAAAGVGGGRTTDTRGAVATIAHQPYGRALVALLALGFAALGAWFVVEPVADRENRTRDWKGALSRVGKACGGLGYFALALWAAGLALGGGAGPSSNTLTRSYTARALALPGGRVLVLAAAVIAVIVAVNQLHTGWQTFIRPRSRLALDRMDPRLQRWAPRLALAGYGTQGAVIGIMGAFLAQAALEHRARDAIGFDGALAAVARQPYGMALLAIASLGLIAYSATAAIEARCKRL